MQLHVESRAVPKGNAIERETRDRRTAIKERDQFSMVPRFGKTFFRVFLGRVLGDSQAVSQSQVLFYSCFGLLFGPPLLLYYYLLFYYYLSGHYYY